MVMTERMQPAGPNRVVLRRLQPRPDYAGADALQRVFVGPLAEFDTGRVCELLGRNLQVPNWALALSVAATLGISVAFSSGLATHPAQPAAMTTARTELSSPYLNRNMSGLTLISQGGPVAGTGSASNGEVAILQSQAQSMNADLQQLQQDNDALRNLARQQGGDLSGAQTNLASAQDLLQGEAQDLGSRLAAIQQNVGARVPGLQSAAKAAIDVVNQIRRLLGMPAINS